MHLPPPLSSLLCCHRYCHYCEHRRRRHQDCNCHCRLICHYCFLTWGLTTVFAAALSVVWSVVPLLLLHLICCSCLLLSTAILSFVVSHMLLSCLVCCYWYSIYYNPCPVYCYLLLLPVVPVFSASSSHLYVAYLWFWQSTLNSFPLGGSIILVPCTNVADNIIIVSVYCMNKK